MRRVVLVAGVYLLAAVALTWPLAAHMATRLGANEGPGDAYLNLWVLGWGVRSWTHDPWGTLLGRAFDAPVFHPAPRSLIYFDYQLAQALIAAPLVAATGNLTLAYNVVLLGSIAASGAAMHVLARSVTGSTFAAFVAGLAWACWPYRTAQLDHPHLQALYLMPLALWALARVAARRRWRDAIVLGLMAGLQTVVSLSYEAMTAVLLIVAAVTLSWTTGQWRATRYWSRVAAAAALAVAIGLPVAVPYGRASPAVEGARQSVEEASNQAASLQSYTQVPPGNVLYGRTGLLAPRPPGPGERDQSRAGHQMFPGLVLMGLACWGLWSGWRSDAKPMAVTGAALVGAGLWLSLGPEGPAGLYQWTVEHVGGFTTIRAPAHFAVVAALGAALLAALAVARLEQMQPGRPARILATLLVAALLAEYMNRPLDLVAAPATDTDVGRFLRDAPDAGPVVYLPIGLDGQETPFMIEALQHGRPIVNGYSDRAPREFHATVEALNTLPAAEGLAMLKELHVRFVVVPAGLWPMAPEASLVERARFGERVVYEVRWPASAAASPANPAATVPPSPAEIPFGPGEEAAYEVRWIGQLPAGEIVLRALEPTAADRERWPGAAWRFEAAARTADWVSRFFEARDRFQTLATGALIPLVHWRDIDEGSRHLTRAYVYDTAAGLVRSAAGLDEARAPGAVTGPLADGARDGLAALFYLRALPPAERASAVVPVNDGGRPMAVRVLSDEIERVSARRGAVEAHRLQIALEPETEGREAIDATLWLSSDEHRIPLRLELTAGFGRIHVELVDYRP